MSLSLKVYFDLDTGNEPYRCDVYSGGITHNMGEMASECGLYEPMWRPYRMWGVSDEDEDGFALFADEIADKVRVGLVELVSNPNKYKKLNPENGWGDYDMLVRVASAYLEACDDYPKAKVSVCR